MAHIIYIYYYAQLPMKLDITTVKIIIIIIIICQAKTYFALIFVSIIVARLIIALLGVGGLLPALLPTKASAGLLMDDEVAVQFKFGSTFPWTLMNLPAALDRIPVLDEIQQNVACLGAVGTRRSNRRHRRCDVQAVIQVIRRRRNAEA